MGNVGSMSKPVKTSANKIKPSKEPRVSCRVSRQLMERLEKIAVRNGIDVSDVVRMSLNRVLPEYEKAA